MKKSLLISLGIISLFLEGCINHPINSNSSFKNNELSIWKDFSINSSTKFKGRIIRDDGSIAFTTYDFGNTKGASDYSIFLYKLSSSDCPDYGVIYPVINEEKESSKTMWGKITNISDPSVQPNCYGEMNFWKPTNEQPVTNYAFCSINKGRQALICLSQKTDNFEAAKELFETFQWKN
jgi:hypothetical protein